MTVGLIGAGTIAEDHIQAYRSLGVPIRAIADLQIERAVKVRQKFGIPIATPDWTDLIRDKDIKIIGVLTPPHLHSPMVISALEAGKNVICEKPLAPTLAECDLIREASERSPGKLTIVHQLRFRPEYQILKWLVQGGHLGRIYMAFVSRISGVNPLLVDQGRWGLWEQHGGGMIMTQSIHQLDLLLWILGKAQRVQAMMGTGLYPIESEDHAVVNIEFKSGVIASVCISGNPFQSTSRWDIIGDKGMAGSDRSLKLSDPLRQASLENDLHELFPRKSPWKQKLARVFGGPASWNHLTLNDHVPLIRSFLESLQGTQDVPVTVQEGRDAVELATAIYAAALKGDSIELPLSSDSRYFSGFSREDYANHRQRRQGSTS